MVRYYQKKDHPGVPPITSRKSLLRNSIEERFHERTNLLERGIFNIVKEARAYRWSKGREIGAFKR